MRNTQHETHSMQCSNGQKNPVNIDRLHNCVVLCTPDYKF